MVTALGERPRQTVMQLAKSLEFKGATRLYASNPLRHV
jgi:hypothetical protein